MSQVPHIAGIPRFLYRQALEQCWQWVRALGRGDALDVLIEELRALQHVGVLSECWRRRLKSGSRNAGIADPTG
jgi:hypothetical protein